MSIQDIGNWNQVYGLNKTLLKNFVVGVVMVLLFGNIFFINRYSSIQRKFNDYKDEMYEKLEKKNNKMDSITREVYKELYKIKIRNYELQSKGK